MTHFVNPREVGKDLVSYLIDLTDGGADYSFEYIEDVNIMRQALGCTRRGWGESIRSVVNYGYRASTQSQMIAIPSQ